VSRTLFTGERLRDGDALFGVDLQRHRVAYRFASQLAARDPRPSRILELGSGTGYGTAELAGAAPLVVGVDRIAPDPSARSAGPRFLRADLGGIPIASTSFDLIVSFQVIEHLRDPGDYLDAIARILRPGGIVVITTPNRLTSDGENPFHVHEYRCEELREVLGRYFEAIEMLGVGQTAPVARYHDARLRRIRTITRLDPLRLRDRLPRPLVEWLFGRLAILVRKLIASGEGLPDVTLADFPIGAVDEACLDLVAVCRRPRASRRDGDA